MKRQIKAAVLGCTGYTGIELIKILIKHPDVIISFLGSQNHQGEYINDFDQLYAIASVSNLENKAHERLEIHWVFDQDKKIREGNTFKLSNTYYSKNFGY